MIFRFDIRTVQTGGLFVFHFDINVEPWVMEGYVKL